MGEGEIDFQAEQSFVGINQINIEQVRLAKSNANIVLGNQKKFNIVNQNLNPSSTLYTQVSKKPFSVKVVSSPAFKGNVRLELIKYDSLAEVINSPSCQKDASVLRSFNFADKDTDGDGVVKVDDISIQESYRYLGFRIRYEQDSKQLCSYSTDKFAVRPAFYTLELNESSPFIGGREYSLISQTVGGYDSKEANMTITSRFPPSCTLKPTFKTKKLLFTDGKNLSNFKTSNIGLYEFTIDDTKWTEVDKVGGTFSDCIKDSNQITHDKYGRVGCDIKTRKTFIFEPRAFRNFLALKNFNDKNFTYISSAKDMKASILIKTQAILDFNSTDGLYGAKFATAYDKNCYARDINATLKLLKAPSGWLKEVSAVKKINFQDDKNTTFMLSEPLDGSISLSSNSTNFIDGTSLMRIFVNFDKNITKPQNPFILSSLDFNITKIEDSHKIKGASFNRTAESNATFYYGRAYAPSGYYRGKSPLNSPLFYEVYCHECNKTKYTIFDHESIDSVNWFVNKAHTSKEFGAVQKYESESNKSKLYKIKHFVSGGVEELTWENSFAPIIDNIKLYVSPWLVYNKYNQNATLNTFSLEFTSRGKWAGKGDLGEVIEQNTAKRVSKRLQW